MPASPPAPAPPPPNPAAAPPPARLHECAGCGQVQRVPHLHPGEAARCRRCDGMLRQGRADPLGRGLALGLAALVLLGIACVATLMQVSTVGMVRATDLLEAPEAMGASGLWVLTAVVLGATVVAPVLRLSALCTVLAGLRLARPPRLLRRLFTLSERLRPWAMAEVMLLGVLIAYSKLVDLVHVDIGVALYALGLLVLLTVAAEVALDPHAVWEEMERRGVPPLRIDHHAPLRAAEGVVGCHVCGLVCLPEEHDRPCPRCGSRLHPRKPDALARAWALLIAGAILYVPANAYPVMQVIQLGAGQPSTILGGVVELMEGGLYPLAALVFVASVVVPVLKLLGLAVLLVACQRGARGRLRDRTRLYGAVNFIGRWSMIDIFMETILVALVQFGAVVRILPGPGAVAFCAVVILTMLAAESFDPRLMWDSAGANGPAAAARIRRR
ncbi:paraquat-inducible protein A [Roseicella aquatilis]|nr:PqiA/YebS family transporter subunit [Roseicella aquatilis]